MSHLRTPTLAAFVLFGTVAACQPEAEPTVHDLVLAGGRVMDPESGADSVLNVGIRDGVVVSVTGDTLLGEEVMDVSGLVVAPGFIDLHAHGQDPFSRDLQVRDGVTTALELESGGYPIEEWYAERQDWRINHGASASYSEARRLAFDSAAGETIYGRADEARVAEIQRHLEAELSRGALGVGLGLQYLPGAGRPEIFRMFQTAAEHGVTVFVHVRYSGVLEPTSAIAAVQEMVGNAAGTGASVHVVHIGSTGLSQMGPVLEMIAGAQEVGVDVTTEIYPYTAASTSIGSAIFDPGWRQRLGANYGDIEWVATGERLDAGSFARRRSQGGIVIAHIIPEEAMLQALVHPIVMVASDGVAFVNGRAHPRGAGTFARVLGRYSRDEGRLGLMEALRKMTLMPARRLEAMVPEMAAKGRVSPGADADLTVFDPETVLDRATFVDPDQPSTGIPHVLVGGVFVVRDGELVDFAEGTAPGRAIRRTRK